MKTIVEQISKELAVASRQVTAAVGLLDDGASVPFIARYRKEATGGLDDSQLRALEDRLGYLRELEARRSVVLNSVQDQGKLTADLEQAIKAADTKTRLEDLYLPYKPKRRTKAQIAREAGLEPLARRLLEHPNLSPEGVAREFVDAKKGVADVKAALDGARQVLMEIFAEDAELLGQLRDYLWDNADLKASLVAGKEKEGAKFSDYFDFTEPVHKIPSHRVLALFRGRNEGILSLALDVAPEGDGAGVCEQMIAGRFGVQMTGRPADAWLRDTVRWAWRVKLLTHLDLELKMRLKARAEEEAINVFARNLKDLLLAAPAGRLPIIGLDPGLRTGVKVAVVDEIGKVLDTATIFPHPPRNRWDEAISGLAALARKYNARLLSIGNGTASRETDRMVGDLIRRHPELGLRKVMVSEAGASVYSASEYASRELPEMDVSLRGAVSIARRLQDPLAELVKIEPKSIGVGQYQHDVNQPRLTRMLGNVIEDCVNAVGVDVNTASAALLRQVSGLSQTLADNIVKFRDERGAFADRASLKKVPRLGAKTYEQAAGFLRVPGGRDPLDASGVHPEAYPVVRRILADSGKSMRELIGDSALLRRLPPANYTDERFGLPTVRDIMAELEKPGRDPRPEFKTASFQEGVENLKDLAPDMVLEGVVTNVTKFGAFIDVGVHQDGLVHISAMADHFVKDPRDVVKAGDIVKVKVLEVDLERKRIALSMRLSGRAERPSPSGAERRGPSAGPGNQVKRDRTERKKTSSHGTMAQALAKVLKKP